MRVFKVMFIGMIVSVFLAGQAYSAPKGNNGKGNNGKGQAVKVNKGNNKATAQTKGQAAVHKQQARRAKEAKQKRENRNRFKNNKPSSNNGKSDLAFNKHATKTNNDKRNGEKVKNEQGKKAVDLLNALDRARWSHNPQR